MGRNLFTMLLLMILPYVCSTASAAHSAAVEYKKANALFAAAQYREAITLYQRILAAPKDDVPTGDVHTRIGDSYFRLGHYRNAIDSYKNALRDQKRADRPMTHYWIGFCLFLLGRDAEAEREFLKIPELYPSSGMWISTAYYWAGRASERMGRKEQAALYYKKAGGNGKGVQGRFAMTKALNLEP